MKDSPGGSPSAYVARYRDAAERRYRSDSGYPINGSKREVIKPSANHRGQRERPLWTDRNSALLWPKMSNDFAALSADPTDARCRYERFCQQTISDGGIVGQNGGSYRKETRSKAECVLADSRKVRVTFIDCLLYMLFQYHLLENRKRPSRA